MRIFDPHIHMSARTTNDYAAMYLAGVRAVVEPAFWLGQPRTNVGSFVDYFDGLIGWERFRAAQYGIRHHATIGLNPKEANDPRCREVLAVLPRYLAKDGVVAVGELGYDSMTAEEDEVFVAQLALAREFELPAMVHTPHRDKAAGTLRTLDVIRDAGIDPGMVVVDHLNETTVASVADSGCWMGFSIYPDTKMDEARMVAILREHGTERVLVNSAADWGNSDPLKTRKTGHAMLDAGFTEHDVDVVLWQNPVAFYGQSGRLHLDPVPGFDESTDASGAADASNAPTVPAAGATFEGNSVLRGARV